MRFRFVTCLHDIMQENERVVLLLAGVGGYSFRKLAPGRVIDLGISEQALIGTAAGMAMEGFIPVVYTIAPFLVERALEQIKLDICAQGLKVILVSAGASYDYSGEGPTHQCPEDVALLMNMPGLSIVVPGSPDDFEALFRYSFSNANSYYFRLAQRSNPIDGQSGWYHKVTDPQCLVISVGPTEGLVRQALGEKLEKCNHVNISVVRPLDEKLLRSLLCERVLIVEPYYPALAAEIMQLADYPLQIRSVGVERKFYHGAHTIDELDRLAGLSAGNIQETYERLTR